MGGGGAFLYALFPAVIAAKSRYPWDVFGVINGYVFERGVIQMAMNFKLVFRNGKSRKEIYESK